MSQWTCEECNNPNDTEYCSKCLKTRSCPACTSINSILDDLCHICTSTLPKIRNLPQKPKSTAPPPQSSTKRKSPPQVSQSSESDYADSAKHKPPAAKSQSKSRGRRKKGDSSSDASSGDDDGVESDSDQAGVSKTKGRKSAGDNDSARGSRSAANKSAQDLNDAEKQENTGDSDDIPIPDQDDFSPFPQPSTSRSSQHPQPPMPPVQLAQYAHFSDYNYFYQPLRYPLKSSSQTFETSPGVILQKSFFDRVQDHLIDLSSKRNPQQVAPPSAESISIPPCYRFGIPFEFGSSISSLLYHESDHDVTPRTLCEFEINTLAGLSKTRSNYDTNVAILAYQIAHTRTSFLPIPNPHTQPLIDLSLQTNTTLKHFEHLTSIHAPNPTPSSSHSHNNSTQFHRITQYMQSSPQTNPTLTASLCQQYLITTAAIFDTVRRSAQNPYALVLGSLGYDMLYPNPFENQFCATLWHNSPVLQFPVSFEKLNQSLLENMLDNEDQDLPKQTGVGGSDIDYLRILTQLDQIRCAQTVPIYTLPRNSKRPTTAELTSQNNLVDFDGDRLTHYHLNARSIFPFLQKSLNDAAHPQWSTFSASNPSDFAQLISNTPSTKYSTDNIPTVTSPSSLQTQSTPPRHTTSTRPRNTASPTSAKHPPKFQFSQPLMTFFPHSIRTISPNCDLHDPYTGPKLYGINWLWRFFLDQTNSQYHTTRAAFASPLFSSQFEAVYMEHLGKGFYNDPEVKMSNYNMNALAFGQLWFNKTSSNNTLNVYYTELYQRHNGLFVDFGRDFEDLLNLDRFHATNGQSWRALLSREWVKRKAQEIAKKSAPPPPVPPIQGKSAPKNGRGVKKRKQHVSDRDGDELVQLTDDYPADQDVDETGRNGNDGGSSAGLGVENELPIELDPFVLNDPSNAPPTSMYSAVRYILRELIRDIYFNHYEMYVFHTKYQSWENYMAVQSGAAKLPTPVKQRPELPQSLQFLNVNAETWRDQWYYFDKHVTGHPNEEALRNDFNKYNKSLTHWHRSLSQSIQDHSEFPNSFWTELTAFASKKESKTAKNPHGVLDPPHYAHLTKAWAFLHIFYKFVAYWYIYCALEQHRRFVFTYCDISTREVERVDDNDNSNTMRDLSQVPTENFISNITPAITITRQLEGSSECPSHRTFLTVTTNGPKSVDSWTNSGKFDLVDLLVDFSTTPPHDDHNGDAEQGLGHLSGKYQDSNRYTHLSDGMVVDHKKYLMATLENPDNRQEEVAAVFKLLELEWDEQFDECEENEGEVQDTTQTPPPCQPLDGFVQDYIKFSGAAGIDTLPASQLPPQDLHWPKYESLYYLDAHDGGGGDGDSPFDNPGGFANSNNNVYFGGKGDQIPASADDISPNYTLVDETGTEIDQFSQTRQAITRVAAHDPSSKDSENRKDGKFEGPIVVDLTSDSDNDDFTKKAAKSKTKTPKKPTKPSKTQLALAYQTSQALTECPRSGLRREESWFHDEVVERMLSLKHLDTSSEYAKNIAYGLWGLHHQPVFSHRRFPDLTTLQFSKIQTLISYFRGMCSFSRLHAQQLPTADDVTLYKRMIETTKLERLVFSNLSQKVIEFKCNGMMPAEISQYIEMIFPKILHESQLQLEQSEEIAQNNRRASQQTDLGSQHLHLSQATSSQGDDEQFSLSPAQLAAKHAFFEQYPKLQPIYQIILSHFESIIPPHPSAPQQDEGMNSARSTARGVSKRASGRRKGCEMNDNNAPPSTTSTTITPRHQRYVEQLVFSALFEQTPLDAQYLNHPLQHRSQDTTISPHFRDISTYDFLTSINSLPLLSQQPNVEYDMAIAFESLAPYITYGNRLTEQMLPFTVSEFVDLFPPSSRTDLNQPDLFSAHADSHQHSTRSFPRTQLFSQFHSSHYPTYFKQKLFPSPNSDSSESSSYSKNATVKTYGYVLKMLTKDEKFIPFPPIDVLSVLEHSIPGAHLMWGSLFYVKAPTYYEFHDIKLQEYGRQVQKDAKATLDKVLRAYNKENHRYTASLKREERAQRRQMDRFYDSDVTPVASRSSLLGSFISNGVSSLITSTSKLFSSRPPAATTLPTQPIQNERFVSLTGSLYPISNSKLAHHQSSAANMSRVVPAQGLGAQSNYQRLRPPLDNGGLGNAPNITKQMTDGAPYPVLAGSRHTTGRNALTVNPSTNTPIRSATNFHTPSKSQMKPPNAQSAQKHANIVGTGQFVLGDDDGDDGDDNDNKHPHHHNPKHSMNPYGPPSILPDLIPCFNTQSQPQTPQFEELNNVLSHQDDFNSLQSHNQRPYPPPPPLPPPPPSNHSQNERKAPRYSFGDSDFDTSGDDRDAKLARARHTTESSTLSQLASNIRKKPGQLSILDSDDDVIADPTPQNNRRQLKYQKFQDFDDFDGEARVKLGNEFATSDSDPFGHDSDSDALFPNKPRQSSALPLKSPFRPKFHHPTRSIIRSALSTTESNVLDDNSDVKPLLAPRDINAILQDCTTYKVACAKLRNKWSKYGEVEADLKQARELLSSATTLFRKIPKPTRADQQSVLDKQALVNKFIAKEQRLSEEVAALKLDVEEQIYQKRDNRNLPRGKGRVEKNLLTTKAFAPIATSAATVSPVNTQNSQFDNPIDDVQGNNEGLELDTIVQETQPVSGKRVTRTREHWTQTQLHSSLIANREELTFKEAPISKMTQELVVVFPWDMDTGTLSNLVQALSTTLETPPSTVSKGDDECVKQTGRTGSNAKKETPKFLFTYSNIPPESILIVRIPTRILDIFATHFSLPLLPPVSSFTTPTDSEYHHLNRPKATFQHYLPLDFISAFTVRGEVCSTSTPPLSTIPHHRCICSVIKSYCDHIAELFALSSTDLPIVYQRLLQPFGKWSEAIIRDRFGTILGVFKHYLCDPVALKSEPTYDCPHCPHCTDTSYTSYPTSPSSNKTITNQHFCTCILRRGAISIAPTVIQLLTTSTLAAFIKPFTTPPADPELARKWISPFHYPYPSAHPLLLAYASHLRSLFPTAHITLLHISPLAQTSANAIHSDQGVVCTIKSPDSSPSRGKAVLSKVTIPCTCRLCMLAIHSNHIASFPAHSAKPLQSGQSRMQAIPYILPSSPNEFHVLNLANLPLSPFKIVTNTFFNDLAIAPQVVYQFLAVSKAFSRTMQDTFVSTSTMNRVSPPLLPSASSINGNADIITQEQRDARFYKQALHSMILELRDFTSSSAEEVANRIESVAKLTRLCTRGLIFEDNLEIFAEMLLYGALFGLESTISPGLRNEREKLEQERINDMVNTLRLKYVVIPRPSLNACKKKDTDMDDDDDSDHMSITTWTPITGAKHFLCDELCVKKDSMAMATVVRNLISNGGYNEQLKRYHEYQNVVEEIRQNASNESISKEERGRNEKKLKTVQREVEKQLYFDFNTTLNNQIAQLVLGQGYDRPCQCTILNLALYYLSNIRIDGKDPKSKKTRLGEKKSYRLIELVTGVHHETLNSNSEGFPAKSGSSSARDHDNSQLSQYSQNSQ